VKVLMTADAVGGVWAFTLELASGLSARGVEVHVATMGPAPDRHQLEQARRAGLAGLRRGDHALEWEPEPWRDVARAGDWLLEMASELAVDVVHLNGYAHGALPWDVPVVVAGHSCVLSWHEAVRGALPGRDVEAYRAAVTRGIRSADALVAPTAAMLAQLERLYAPACPSLVIHNGRDQGPFAAREKEPFVLGIGRLWDEAKNLDALDRAAAAISWPVLLAGDAGGRTATSARLLGPLGQTEVAGLLGRASLFASPALYEPFGLAALEAGLSGCALVLGDIPTLREVWGHAARFVPPGDPEALARALEHLIADEAERRDAARTAHARALGYGRARMTVAYAELYAQLVGVDERRRAGRTAVTA
jgi:glycogen(starch) synthase